jgi:hypothetical protein
MADHFWNVKGLEPEALDAYRPHNDPISAEARIGLSTAISLKRIADALEGGGLADKLEDSIVRAIGHGADNAISSWLRHR